VLAILLHHKAIPHPTSKEWVIFIHGMGGSSSIWFKQIREFRKHFNLMLIDLPGHGSSTKGLLDENERSFVQIAKRVLSVLDHHRIHVAHFVGISLGTIIIQVIQSLAPERVKTMTLGGAVERIYPPLRLLAQLLEWVKYLIPYMWLYRLVAWILMPRERHRESRQAFIKEAVNLGQKEFFCWYQLLYREINAFFERKRIYDRTPTIYIMGREDFMFLPIIQKRYRQLKHACLHIIEKCGHVCNIEKEKEFNELSINFIHSHIEAMPQVKKA
jgi:pimeloyl-ACP methyl ester carboxylesterase